MIIHDLTPAQHNMLEIMWNISSKNDLGLFAAQLPKQDQNMVWTLYHLCLIQSHEDKAMKLDMDWVLPKIREIQQKYS